MRRQSTPRGRRAERVLHQMHQNCYSANAYRVSRAFYRVRGTLRFGHQVDGSDRRTLTTSFGSHFFDLIVVHEELLVSDWTTRLAKHSEGLSFSYNVSFQRVSNDKVTSNTDILPAQLNRRL